MKKILTVSVLLFVFLFSITSMAFAGEKDKIPPGHAKKAKWKAGLTLEQLHKLKARDVKDRLRVKGKLLEYDVPPVIINGRTLIPVRAITMGLGASVDWDGDTKRITVKRDDVTVILTIGNMKLLVNGEEMQMDVPAQLICNRTFVPLRFIVIALGDRVDYDEDTGDIDIIGRLDTPARPVLAGNIATWQAVPNENNGYSLRLFRNSNEVTTVSVAYGAPLSYDFSSYMTLPGSYTVRVKALATGDYTDSRESKPSLPQIVNTTVPVPAAPTLPVVDDIANTFGWTLVPGYPNLTQYEYSTDSGATWQPCTANPQPVGNNSYAAGAVMVRVKADTSSGRPAGYVLASNAPFTAVSVPVPAAPTLPVVDDIANTFGWTLVPGYPNLTQYEYSTDSGATWQPCTANPQPVGNNSYAAGAIMVRVKADTSSGRPAGYVLASNAPFTAVSTVTGPITGLAAAAGSSPAQVSVTYINNGITTTVSYNVLDTTQILINGQPAQFSSLQLGDAATATLQDNVLTKLEITR